MGVAWGEGLVKKGRGGCSRLLHLAAGAIRPSEEEAQIWRERRGSGKPDGIISWEIERDTVLSAMPSFTISRFRVGYILRYNFT